MANPTAQDWIGKGRAPKDRPVSRNKTCLLICGAAGFSATGAIRVKDTGLNATNQNGSRETNPPNE